MMDGNCQIALPLEGAESISHEEIERMVYQQADNVNMQKWETSLLIESCNKIGCLSQGLSRLYQYAGYQDKVFVRLKKRHDIASELDTAIMGSSDKMPRKISKMAFATANLISSICQWRQQQWSPRPLTELLPGESTPTSVCEVIRRDARKLFEKVRLQALGVEQAREEGFSTVDSGWVPRCDILCLSLLLAPVKGAAEIEALVLNTSAPGAGSPGPTVDLSLFKELLEYRPEEVSDPELWLTVIGAVHSFLSLEAKVDAFWHSRINIIQESRFKVEQTCPLLRLPYEGASVGGTNGVPCVNFSWFGEMLDVYRAVGNVLDRVLGLIHPNTAGTGSSGSVVLSSSLNSSTGRSGAAGAPLSLGLSLSHPTSPVAQRGLKTAILGMTANGIIERQEAAHGRYESAAALLSSDNRKFVPERHGHGNGRGNGNKFGSSWAPMTDTVNAPAPVFAPFRQNVPVISLAGFVPQTALETREVQHEKMHAYIQQVGQAGARSSSPKAGAKSPSPKASGKKISPKATKVSSPVVVPQSQSQSQSQSFPVDNAFAPVDSFGSDPMGDFILSASRTFRAQRQQELQLQDRELRLHQQEQKRALAAAEAATRATAAELDQEVARLSMCREVTKSMGVLPMAGRGAVAGASRRGSADRPRTAGAASLDPAVQVAQPRRKSTETLAVRAAGVVNSHQQRLNKQAYHVAQIRASPGSSNVSPSMSPVDWMDDRVSGKGGETPVGKNLFSTGKLTADGELVDEGDCSPPPAADSTNGGGSDAFATDYVELADNAMVNSDASPVVSSKTSTAHTALPLITTEGGSTAHGRKGGAEPLTSKLFKSNGMGGGVPRKKSVSSVGAPNSPKSERVRLNSGSGLVMEAGRRRSRDPAVSAPVQLTTPKRTASPVLHGRKTATTGAGTAPTEGAVQRSPFKAESSKCTVAKPGNHLSQADLSYIDNPRGQALPPGFTSRSMKTLGMFASVSKPFSRGEARSESQVLLIALKDMKTKSLTRDLRVLAARKLALWWSFLFPRFRFIRHKATKRYLREEVVSQLLLSRVFVKVDARINAKLAVRKIGAAVLITRNMVRYCNSFIPFIRRWQRMWRAYRKKHAKRFNHTRRERHRKEEEAARRQAAAGGYQYVRREPRASMGVNNAGNSKNFQQVNKRVVSATLIQTHVRRMLGCRAVLRRRYAYALITDYAKYWKAKRLWSLMKPRIKAVKMLQQYVRGYVARRLLKERIVAGIVITAAYRRYIRRLACRKQLHRCDRPVTIVLHGIRNIPQHMVFTETVSVKISVWWSQLLHIVSERDFSSIVATKPANLVHQTEWRPVQEQVEGPNGDGGATFEKSAVRSTLAVDNRSSPIAKLFKPSAFIARARTKSGSAAESVSSSSSSSDSSDSDSKSAKTSPPPTPSIIMPKAPAPRPAPVPAPVAINPAPVAGNMALPGNRRTIGGPGQGLPGLGTGGNAQLMAALAAKAPPEGEGRSSTMVGEIGGNLIEGITDVGSSLARGFKSSFLKPLGGFIGQGHTRNKRGSSIDSQLVKVSLNEETIEIPACHGNTVIKFDFMDGDRKLGSFVYFMSQRDPKKLMFWGGENLDELVLNQGRRGLAAGTRKQSSANLLVGLGQQPSLVSKAVMRRQSMRRMSGLVDLSHSKAPLFEFRVVGGKPLVSLATFLDIKVSGIAGSLTRTMQHQRGLISCLLEPYHRFFVSINGHDGKLNIFKDRKNVTPLQSVLLSHACDISFLVDGVNSPFEGNKGSLNIVVLHFKNGEKIFFRTADHGDRRRLQFILFRVLGRDPGFGALYNRPKRSSSAGNHDESSKVRCLI